jgi:hypothetical protein
MAALDQLRARGRRLVLHVYYGHAGPVPWQRYRALLLSELGFLERCGFDVELVLRFVPFVDPRDVRSFVAFVRRIVGTFGSNRRLVSVQITNEADRGGSASSDGYFNRGHAALDALIQGVIAAKATAMRRHFDQLQVGFNYATTKRAFWRFLGRRGGPRFRRSLDWIGIDTYPGTLTPLPARTLRGGIADAISRSLHAARHTFLPLAGIPDRVALLVSEDGYATGGGHTGAMQIAALETSVRTVASLSRADHVTEYHWFDLRDASSSTTSTSGQFGLPRHDDRPKPAFASYRRLIRLFGP